MSKSSKKRRVEFKKNAYKWFTFNDELKNNHEILQIESIDKSLILYIDLEKNDGYVQSKGSTFQNKTSIEIVEIQKLPFNIEEVSDNFVKKIIKWAVSE